LAKNSQMGKICAFPASYYINNFLTWHNYQ
jgi:hypothetical protein